MPTKVLMPSLGESVEEAVLTRWLKARGEPVEEYEPLLEVNTDKVDTEVPSPANGVILDILITEGSTVQAGELLAWIGKPGEKIPAQSTSQTVEEMPETESVSTPAASAAQIPSTAPIQPGRNRELGFISPVVARIASEHQIDLTEVDGSGQGGRITKRDVLTYLEQRQAERLAAAETTSIAPPAGSRVAPETVAAAAPVQPPLPTPSGTRSEGEELIPHTAVRRAIAEHMVRSKHTSPHVTTVMEVDLSRVIAHRSKNKAAYAREGVNLTFTAYFTAAASGALQAQPIVNSSWSEDGVILHKSINIGLATSLGEAGLIVPVIKNTPQYSLLGLAGTINDLAGRARARQLQPDEVQGGTFTITNHGVSGSLFAMPIINQPQCAILGIGAIQKRVVVIEDPASGDSIAIRPMVYLTLTFDHRILDGAVADAFLSKMVELLRDWH